MKCIRCGSELRKTIMRDGTKVKRIIYQCPKCSKK